MLVGLTSTDQRSSSTVMVNCLPQRQQNILVVSQPSRLIIPPSIVSDTHITSSKVATFSVTECLTTNSSSGVVTSVSGQCGSTITKAGDLMVSM